MRAVIVAIALLLPTLATAAPVKGQPVLYRWDSTHVYHAVITKVISGNTVNLVAFSHVDANWGDGNSGSIPAIPYDSVPMGSCDDCWTDNTPPQLPQLVTSTSTPSFTLNGSAIQSSTTRDVELTFTVSVSNTLTLAGGQSGQVDLVCDSSASPSTVVQTGAASSTGTVVIGISLTTSTTLVLRHRVPAGDYCKLTSTGTGTTTLVRQIAQVLG